MPGPTPSAPPIALSQLPAQAIHQRFVTRPAFYSVVLNALRELILERYPSLELEMSGVKLAIPHPDGHYTYRPLMEVAIDHVLKPQLLDLHSERELPYYLTQKIPDVLKPASLPLIDMQVIAQLIDELPGSLYLYFQQALADYWSEIDSHGGSRWQWLAQLLNGQMTATAARQSSLNQLQRDMLTVTAAWPVLNERLPHSTPPTYAYFIENTFTRDGETVRLLTPDLLLVRDRQVLLYCVDGRVEPFDSTDAFGSAWAVKMQHRFQFDSLTWRRNEPDNNVFEQQAGLILNQQLEDLATLSFQGQDEVSIGRRLEKLTDPAVLFTHMPVPAAPLLQKVDNQLPEWLRQADAADRFAYHRHLQDMAQVLHQNQGRSFNEGIDTLQSFSRTALRKQMQKDHAPFDPDQVLLDFAVAAGYPGGAGIIEHVRMSLTELAVRNLAGKPKGALTLSSTTATPLPSWLTENYLLGSSGLIQRIDIGTAYPQHIKDLLLSGSVEAQRREALFTRELKVKLPMQALEYKIRRLHGVTVTGYRYVKALMGETPADRMVDERQIVLRPLALCRTVGATPDEVTNAFIIEPRDVSVGPHLLFRPLYTDTLHEYPTRQALLDALAAPGELQDSVLTWLSDTARPIYDHGGFTEPHLIRFLPGDEFTIPDKPAPATLAVDEGVGEWLQWQINGFLLSHVFGSTARALVDLADRESVSNHESRWAIVMEGAWLLFNTLLLPLARGPAMLMGWFFQLLSSLEQDLAGLQSNDPTTREIALIDLLLNTAMVLMHAAAPSDRSPQVLAAPAAQEHVLHLQTWRRTAGLPHPAEPPLARHGLVALPGEPPAGGETTLDFTHSLASAKAGAMLFKALLEVNVPWPDPVPAPLPSGVLKGLYWIDGKWHASIGGLLFQVNVVPGFAEVYLVHPAHAQHPGFKLISDGQGHWRLDRHARLEGGMHKGRVSQLREEKRQNIDLLTSQLTGLQLDVLPLANLTLTLEAAVNNTRAALDTRIKSLRALWVTLNSPTLAEATRARTTEQHTQAQRLALRARIEWNIAVHNFQKNGQALIGVMRNIADKAGELMIADRTSSRYQKERNNALNAIYVQWVSAYASEHTKFAYSLETQRGESTEELGERINRELPANINDAYGEFIKSRDQQLQALKSMIEPVEQMSAILEQADPALRDSLLKETPPDLNFTSAHIKQQLLVLLVDLIFNRAHGSRIPAEYPFIIELADPQVTPTILTHTEMRTTSGYSVKEQIEVLTSILELYERLENAVNSLVEMGSGFIREAYQAPFQTHLDEARSSLEAQLAELIRVEQQLVSLPAPDTAKRPKKTNRKVIKTADRKSLVGDLRPGQADMPGNFVDIKDPLTGKTIVTYVEHASEGVWNVVKEVGATVPAPVAIKRSLRTIEAQAKAVRDERAGIDSSIRFQLRKLQDPTRLEGLDPREWDVLLTQHAAKFEALADEIQRDWAADTRAPALIDEYRKEAVAATLQAREYCSEGYKLQRPRASNVAYLWRHGFVDINLVHSRTPLKAGDFLTEYAIRDKDKIRAGKKGDENVLWYAHFHYPSADTPVAQPAFGHLKTKAERVFTRKELIERARADNRAVVNLEKAEIKPPLDRQLFLGLEVLNPR
ncbi:dermonecrotic toxin domain-containing protein [Pseudomonas orientalis]|uniref:Dermonecrotic toxin N-terminal domain-containing protein n=1 Tax=Pseudomonas orientalis TaxID=76758 RepID=A0A1H2EFM3_9PSED|nr:DUF6543 domain-containing protein [Pseudomonas orientalis]KRP63568.1 hypothetical protein TU82_21210 [Pseudomonas orientalis]SDT93927.1 hypothetical protein SAMN04490197_1155 [Pseudomonas orientalis]